MAEAAAGLYVAGEAVETAAQVGVGAYMVAKPTMPLKATFTQILPPEDEHMRSALARSGHTISIVKDKAFIFGGQTASGTLLGNEVSSVTLPSSEKPDPSYDVASATPFAEEGAVPVARTRHAACALGERIAVFGGLDESGHVISDSSKLWMFDTGKSKWEELEGSDPNVSPKSRSDAHLLISGDANNVVLYGGSDDAGTALKDVWHFSCLTRTWTQLPEAPVSSQHAALTDGVLYLVSETDNIGGNIHYLPITTNKEEEPSWTTIDFPANPLTPGPPARKVAGLVPISTGYGRHYLAYLFGALADKNGNKDPSTTSQQDQAAPREYCSDIWTYQLPSSDPEVKATTNFTEALKPAKIKDKIREALGMDDGKHSWYEVVVEPPTELPESEGKLHPGPRASFACDVMTDRQSVVIWGGVNPKGEMEGDGWVIKLE